MRRKNIVKQNNMTLTVGLMGTSHCAGVTHLAFMLAVFLTLVMGKSVALADMSGSDCLRQAGNMLKNSFCRKNKIFKRISIYEQAELSKLAGLMSEDFDYIIIDFGVDYQKNYGQFLMCSEKLIVGNLSLWKIHSYVEFMAMTCTEESVDGWVFLAPFPDADGVKFFRKNFKKEITAIPCTPDPFCLDGDSLDFLYKLTGRFYKGRRKWKE